MCEWGKIASKKGELSPIQDYTYMSFVWTKTVIKLNAHRHGKPSQKLAE